MTGDRTLIELDNRRRAPLGKLGLPQHTRYLATTDDHGRILLEPAIVLTETESHILKDGAFWSRVEQALEEPVQPFELSS